MADGGQAVPEYALKAAYLYNFAQLTDWPMAMGGPDEPFDVCIFGQDDLYSALEGLRGSQVKGHPVRAVRIAEVAEARQCRLVFIGNAESMRGVHMQDSLRGQPVLTVTDDTKIWQAGAIIMIVSEQRRLSFEVNMMQARRSRLKFSSKLLRLAKTVIGE